jgi:hypothetical protein
MIRFYSDILFISRSFERSEWKKKYFCSSTTTQTRKNLLYATEKCRLRPTRFARIDAPTAAFTVQRLSDLRVGANGLVVSQFWDGESVELLLYAARNAGRGDISEFHSPNRDFGRTDALGYHRVKWAIARCVY